jgi:hypothetical protein
VACLNTVQHDIHLTTHVLSFSPLDPSVPSAYSLALKMLRFTASTFTWGEEIVGEEWWQGGRGKNGRKGERKKREKSKEEGSGRGEISA